LWPQLHGWDALEVIIGRGIFTNPPIFLVL
jgi:hypothetical protein